MEQELLQDLPIFFAGLVLGVLLMLLINKLRSGSASAGKVKQEFDNYQTEVESHFEETSKKFKDMTEQYQDLYKHLAVGATTLCRADSVAAVGLANQSDAIQPAKLEKKVADETVPSDTEAVVGKTGADEKAKATESDKSEALKANAASAKTAPTAKPTPAAPDSSGKAGPTKTDSTKPDTTKPKPAKTSPPASKVDPAKAAQASKQAQARSKTTRVKSQRNHPR